MKIFFGAAIQGRSNRDDDRRQIYTIILDTLKQAGHEVCTEHTTGKDLSETIELMNESVGPLPTDEHQRRIYVRNKMIELVESDIDAGIFELSVPSLGTGIEFAHAYLRPRLGLREIPILALYQKGYWPNHLSTMVRGITGEVVPSLSTVTYESPDDLRQVVRDFADQI